MRVGSTIAIAICLLALPPALQALVAHASHSLVLGQADATPTLGATPRNCPDSSSPYDISPYFASGLGTSPTWAVGFARGPVLHIGNPAWVTHTRYGWSRKVLWVVRPGYMHTVRLSGSSTRHGTPLWFQIGIHDPSTSPTLNPHTPGIPIQHGRWTEFPSYIFIPKSGCYVLEAHWSGGMWRRVFAAGR